MQLVNRGESCAIDGEHSEICKECQECKQSLNKFMMSASA